MSKDASTPRVFLIRHGPTEWSLSGRYTGVTDIPLLPEGEALISQTARVVFGRGKLIDPEKLVKVIVSPRTRAQKTWDLMRYSLPDGRFSEGMVLVKVKDMAETREEVREWGYGDYEGLLTQEILQGRRERGLDKEKMWDMWRDGVEGEGGEMPDDVKKRVDVVIEEIVGLQEEYMKKSREGQSKERVGVGRDILIVAHGHILRAFVKRWLKLEMDAPVELMLEPGGVCGLSYAHHNVNERAVLVGMSFPQ
jgi:sedoheptulose-bisphosphatase